MIPLFGPPFFHTPCSLYSFHSLQHENLSTILKFDGRTHDSFISFPFFSSHNLRHKNLSNFSKIRVFWNMVNARSLYLALLFSIHFILYTRSTACNTKIFPIFKIILKYGGRTQDIFFPYTSSSTSVIGHENLSNFQDSNRILKHDERTIPFPFPPHLILLHTTPLHTHRTYDIYENLPKIRVFRNAVAERTIPLTAVINDARQCRRTLKKPIRGMISRWKILRRSRYFPFFLNPLSKIIASTYTHDNTR